MNRTPEEIKKGLAELSAFLRERLGWTKRSNVLSDALAYIQQFEAIDAEPVVRCNICKYYETDVGFCNYHGHGMDWDGYCSCGAKMDLEVQDDKA